MKCTLINCVEVRVLAVDDQPLDHTRGQLWGAIHKMAATLGDSPTARALRGNFFSQRTVLSGAEERGVDRPSLDRSYFSRLQPISFFFSDPSSSHIAKLAARIWDSISMLHTHASDATHAGPGKRLKCFSTRRRGVVSKSAMPLKKSSSQQTLFACSFELNFPARGRSYF